MQFDAPKKMNRRIRLVGPASATLVMASCLLMCVPLLTQTV